MDTHIIYTLLEYNGKDYTIDLMRRLSDTFYNHIKSIHDHLLENKDTETHVKINNEIWLKTKFFYNMVVQFKFNLKYINKHDDMDIIISEFYKLNTEFTDLKKSYDLIIAKYIKK